MTITTEEAERLARWSWPKNQIADALRSLAAERDSLKADLHDWKAAYYGDTKRIEKERDKYEAEYEKLREALEVIAHQPKTDELDFDVELLDFEGGYDSIIDEARKSLGEKEATND